MGAAAKQRILGIDGGATKTSWVLCEPRDGILHPLRQGRLGPGSMKLLDARGLRRLLSALPGGVTHAGVFLAGCATPADRAQLRALCRRVWPRAVLAVGSDREAGHAAAFGTGDGIAVIAGTGSAVTGRKNGTEDRAGGWGHLLGDSGGGYDLAIRALRDVLFDFDTGRRVTPLAREVLRLLGLNSLRELTAWAQAAEKHDLARLTPLVFAHARTRRIRKELRHGAESLAALTAAVAQRLRFPHPPVRLMGGVFAGQPLYRRLFAKALASMLPGADVALCKTPASHGAALLVSCAPAIAPAVAPPAADHLLERAETEQPNPRSGDLPRQTTRQLVTLFVREEHHVAAALERTIPSLTRAVNLVTRALAGGGKLYYIGAGTSGRLGVLDASEMPPTFGVPPDRVQGLIAGGFPALLQSIEGAEDDAAAGARALTERGAGPRDAVCGITASGRTPFVLGALAAARSLGCTTLLLTCNPSRPRARVDAAIDLPTGPELIAGSTRLKAGTATKVALNILSSCAMVRLGRVNGSSMTHLNASNEKLRARAARIVSEHLGISRAEAEKRLGWSNWSIPAVLKVAKSGPPRVNG